MSQQSSPAVVVSMGDPCGVGWLLFKKILARKSTYLKTKEIPRLKDIVFVGDLFEQENSFVQKNFQVEKFPDSLQEAALLLQKRRSQKPLFLYLQKAKNYTAGKPNVALALRSYFYFQKSLQFWSYLPSASLITLPVSKDLIMRAGVDFNGHTQVLEQNVGQKAIMCMYHPSLSVIPLTQHIPLAQVSREILQTDFEPLRNSLLFFKEFFNVKKPMALTGLNPHAGENGKIGNEESFLTQKLMLLKESGLAVDGPLPADGAFLPHIRKNYSLIITTYHDQGLIPFKALWGAKGLNITLNLPKLRVSPDHGPAYDRAAGDKESDAQSVLNSLRFAMAKGEKWTQVYSSIF